MASRNLTIDVSIELRVSGSPLDGEGKTPSWELSMQYPERLARDDAGAGEAQSGIFPVSYSCLCDWAQGVSSHTRLEGLPRRPSLWN